MSDWTFETLPDFDRHVRAHLPWYDMVTDAVALVARHYIPQGGLVYDIGASTGNVGRAIGATLEEREARLVAIEPCRNLARRYQAPGSLVEADALAFDFAPHDVSILFLTLMFLPVAERAALVARLRRLLRPGGALIVVDKCMPPAGYEAIVHLRLTLAGKVRAGVSAEEIVEKEIALSGVQRPIDIEELGPGALEVFRFGDFAAWIIPA